MDHTTKECIAQFEAISKEHFTATVTAAKRSITDGSPLTGAPGQPVDTSNLKTSWILAFPIPGELASITTNVVYALAVENNVPGAPGVPGNWKRPARFRNHGSHSVKLTIANIDALAADEARKLAGA